MDTFPSNNSMNNCCSTVAVGRIVRIDRNNRTFTILRSNDRSSALRFNVPQNARFFDLFGRPMNFNNLTPGLRVRVNHADFMTLSIPPQTTAFTVRVIR